MCEWDGEAANDKLDLETEYWKLLQSGVGTVAACKLFGIGRKTGCRWRAENGGLPPARLAESARSGRYLSLLERQRIATLRERGLGVREIARRLSRSPSTISRELRRHLRPHDRGIYDGALAHARAREGLRRPRRPLLAREPLLRQIVQDKLREEWSGDRTGRLTGSALRRSSESAVEPACRQGVSFQAPSTLWSPASPRQRAGTLALST